MGLELEWHIRRTTGLCVTELIYTINSSPHQDQILPHTTGMRFLAVFLMVAMVAGSQAWSLGSLWGTEENLERVDRDVDEDSVEDLEEDIDDDDDEDDLEDDDEDDDEDDLEEDDEDEDDEDLEDDDEDDDDEDLEDDDEDEDDEDLEDDDEDDEDDEE